MTQWLRTRLIVGLMGLGAACPIGAQPVEVEGQKFEPTVQVGGQTLNLNGVGLRRRAIFKVYVAGLYVPQKSTDAATLIADKGARRVSLRMLRDVDAGSFIDSFNDGLKNNLSEAQLAALKPQTDALTATLKSIGEAKKAMRLTSTTRQAVALASASTTNRAATRFQAPTFSLRCCAFGWATSPPTSR